MKRPKLTWQTINWPVVWIVIVYIVVTVAALMMGGCDWNQQTVKRWNAQGQIIEYRYTNMGSILKESLIENGSMISEPNYFEITVEHAELNTADIKATTIYGTVEIE